MAEVKKEGVIEGVLVYAKVAQPDKKYQSNDTEYSITVIVDEDTADEWDSEFAKQPSKKIKVSDFETKFRFPCPIEGVKNVYSVTLKKDAVVDGEEMFPDFKPKVFLDTNDGDRLDISESRLIANGSYGKISYRINENTFGRFARLKNVLIEEDNFKEYVSAGGKAGDEFGEKPIKKEPARKEATQARPAKEDKQDDDDTPPAKPAKVAAKPSKPVKKVAPNFDDMDDSIPF